VSSGKKQTTYHDRQIVHFLMGQERDLKHSNSRKTRPLLPVPECSVIVWPMPQISFLGKEMADHQRILLPSALIWKVTRNIKKWLLNYRTVTQSHFRLDIIQGRRKRASFLSQRRHSDVVSSTHMTWGLQSSASTSQVRASPDSPSYTVLYTCSITYAVHQEGTNVWFKHGENQYWPCWYAEVLGLSRGIIYGKVYRNIKKYLNE
jgi:hypothetical protein